jgi:hypothetical protein
MNKKISDPLLFLNIVEYSIQEFTKKCGMIEDSFYFEKRWK